MLPGKNQVGLWQVRIRVWFFQGYVLVPGVLVHQLHRKGALDPPAWRLISQKVYMSIVCQWTRELLYLSQEGEESSGLLEAKLELVKIFRGSTLNLVASSVLTHQPERKTLFPTGGRRNQKTHILRYSQPTGILHAMPRGSRVLWLHDWRPTLWSKELNERQKRKRTALTDWRTTLSRKETHFIICCHFL